MPWYDGELRKEVVNPPFPHSLPGRIVRQSRGGQPALELLCFLFAIMEQTSHLQVRPFTGGSRLVLAACFRPGCLLPIGRVISKRGPN